MCPCRTGPPGASPTTWGVPPVAQFKMAWDGLASGSHGSIDGVGDRRRVHKLGVCIYEAMRSADARFMLKVAQTIWLARDARRQRLLIRFRAVGLRLNHNITGR